MTNLVLAAMLLTLSLFAFSKDISYQIKGQDFEGHIINKGKEAPTVFIVHDWDGLTNYEVKRAQMLSQLGLSVMAIDMFGKGVRPTEVKDKKQHTGELYKDREKMRSLIKGAIDFAKNQGLNTNDAIIMGYCFGGAVALEAARAGLKFNSFVSFHGGLKTPEAQSYKETKGKVLVFHGSADKLIPMNEFAELANELEQNQIPHEMITYSGARHAFSVFGSDRYNQEADTKSWQRLTTYLTKSFNLK